MNLRCIYCQTPFTLSRSEMLGAIVNMNEKNQNHYDAHCPKCRRANSISRQRMELFFPNWRDAARQLPAQAPASPPTSASLSLKTEPISKARKAEVGKVAAKKSSAASSSSKGKSSANKPAAKKPAHVKTTAKKAPAKGKKK